MGSTSKPANITLKDEIAGTLGDQRAIQETPGRTTERDETAQWLLENVIETGEWPLSYNELAERSEWSAGHFRNTYERYFEAADSTGDSQRTQSSTASAASEGGDSVRRELTINVPSDVDEESFMRGWIAGRNARE